VDLVEDESFRLRCPDFADVFVEREAVQRFQPSGEVVGCHEVGEVGAQLVVAFVVEAFHRRLLDRTIHPFDLAVGPRVVWLGQPMFDPVGFADHVEAHWPRVEGVPVAGLLGKLDAIVRENGMDLIGHGFEHALQELPSGSPVSLFNKLGHGKLAGSVDANKEIKLALGRLNLCNINVKEPDWIPLELLPPRLAPLDIRQARDAMSLQAPMQR